MSANYVLFEEDNSFKAGSILMDNETSLQVEMPSGKRGKIKAAQVLLRFQHPAPAQMLADAAPLASEIDVEFLWEIAGEGEFAFLDLAREYYGHDPAAPEAASLLLALHGAPVYFHRKGKGHFRKAPADILKAALASLEKKRQQALAIENWVAELGAGRLPAELAPYAGTLLGKPDRNRPEIKAFEAAAAASQCSLPELLLKTGALKSPYEVHLRRFLSEQFPKGTAFPSIALPPLPDDLPRADGVRAFSIDDAATTEVDDALSVAPLADGGWRIGIHIAAPGLAITHGSPVDAIARARLSTVYMPGAKITMLPEAVVNAYTLEGGRDCPTLSLYLTVDAGWNITNTESRAELTPIAANLRHHEIEPWFNAESVGGALPDEPFRDELLTLWHFANACEARRGKPSASQGVNDYNFEIEGDLADPEACRVNIVARKRGSPLDKLVAELMIIANSTWGGLLADLGVACLYRAQTGGKARMSTAPQPHEGLGVPQYAWMTSPLRRYSDLVCQRQLIAALNGKPPPFAPRSAELFAAMRDFEVTYAAYAEFQRNLERYWCLRYLAQEKLREAIVIVRRDELVRFESLPLFARIPGATGFASGQRLRVAIDGLDDLELDVRCHIIETLDRQEIADDEDDDETATPSVDEATSVTDTAATADAGT
ncbi:MAG: RNB domain-containing ribonuclease [Zoogloeaceae bacterium]|jgi:exoribonuclease-2|nr:RNB domain-containing ribonuclease [Zoogloeaceae bacterium]